jgi:hypothetical protein
MISAVCPSERAKATARAQLAQERRSARPATPED